MDQVITTEDLTKSFAAKGRRVQAVAGLSFGVERGEIFGFLGPNGAGKTTTLRMLTTLLPSTRHGHRGRVRRRPPARRCGRGSVT